MILYNNYIAGARLFGVDLSGAQGLETVRVEWIDVGEEEPIRLEGEAARAWLRQATERKL